MSDSLPHRWLQSRVFLHLSLLSLAVLPHSRAYFTAFRVIFSIAVLASPMPLALEVATIGPGHFSEALLLVVDVRPQILTLVRPGKFAFTVHPVLFPGTDIATTIGPSIYTVSVYVAHPDLTVVQRPVCELEGAFALLLTIEEGTFVPAPILKNLHSEAMLFITLPEAVVVDPIDGDVLAEAVSHIIFPLTIIEGAI